MDTVKAVISIGEASIQLEGPQEFVEKYLNEYKSMIEKGHIPTSTSHKALIEKEAEKPIPKRTRTVKPKAGPTCAEKIRELISEGYFKEPKTTAEISEYLMKQKGYVNTTKDVSANLKGMFDRGPIKRIKEGNAFKYYVNVG